MPGRVESGLGPPVEDSSAFRAAPDPLSSTFLPRRKYNVRFGEAVSNENALRKSGIQSRERIKSRYEADMKKIEKQIEKQT